eukprot:symbB.v1.2.038749.t2/scaffold6157.1/size20450/1
MGENGGMHCTIWHHLPHRGPIAAFFLHEGETELGVIEPHDAFSVNTYEDQVLRFRDVGTQEILATVRMFKSRIVLSLDNDFLTSIANCVDLPQEDWQGSCEVWEQHGQCVQNPGFMTVFCPQTCHACHLQHEDVRCARRFVPMSQQPVLGPGDLDQTFAGMKDRAEKYSSEVQILSTSPWILTFADIISEAEIAALLAAQNEGTFHQSKDQGDYDSFGISEAIVSSNRTSQTAWCQDTCKDTPTYIAVTNRIAEIVQVPRDHFESMQFLKYQVGQYYVEHHDMNEEKENDHPCGPRIYTFFLHFNRLNISVKPRKGLGLLWPSVLSENPTVRDDRTMHEAKAVVHGEKMAANVWIHLFSFETPNL